MNEHTVFFNLVQQCLRNEVWSFGGLNSARTLNVSAMRAGLNQNRAKILGDWSSIELLTLL